jgi:hypothetical protein
MIPTVESDHNNITPEKQGDYNCAIGGSAGKYSEWRRIQT